jgi:predicted PurR-regulated permease PerM
MSAFIQKVLPTASADFVRQFGVTSAALLSKASATVLNSMVSFFSEAPTLLLNVLVVGFVFFFGLRDHEEIIKIASDISPLNRAKEKLLIQQFKDITDSIIYGQFVIGIAQGLLAGIGFLIFGVDKALLLTILTMFCSVIPILGPYIVYIPVAILIFASGDTSTGIAYLLYNIIIVSTLDNFLRTYIVSKKSKMNSAVVFVGMIAGLLMFGIVGLLIGPLILAYFLIIIQLYKEKNLSSLFTKEESVQEQTEKK